MWQSRSREETVRRFEGPGVVDHLQELPHVRDREERLGATLLCASCAVTLRTVRLLKVISGHKLSTGIKG